MMNTLPGIIEAVGKVGIGVGADVMNVLSGIVVLIGGLGLLFTTINKITGNGGLDIAATAKTAASLLVGFAIISTGMLALFTAGGGIAQLLGQEDLIKTIQDGGEVLHALGMAIYGFFSGLFGVKSEGDKRRETEDAINWLTNLSDDMDVSKFVKIGSLMDLVDRIDELKFDATKMELLSGFLPQAGSALAQFAAYIQQIGDGEEGAMRIENMLNSIKVLDAFADAINAVSESLYLVWYTGYGDLGAVFGDQELSSIMDVYTKAAEKLSGAIQEGLGEHGSLNFDATPIIDSIIVALGLGSDRIAKAVHDFVQQGLNYSDQKGSYNVPLPDDTVLNDVGGILEQVLNNDGTLPFDMSAIQNQLTGEGGLLSVLTGFENQIPDMSTMFADKGWNMVDENGNPIDITSELTKQLGTLQDSLAELPAFEVKITPVFDMSQMSASAIQNLLNQRTFGVGMPMPDASIRVDSSQTLARLDGINNRLDVMIARLTSESIQTRVVVGALGDRIDSVANSFAQMRVILDSGAVVGGLSGLIDLELGDRMIIAGRTGVTSLIE